MVKSNGQQLIKMIESRGGSASEYSDIVFGTVLKTKPLTVQLANDMVIGEDFLILGKHIGKFKVQGKAKIKVKAHHDQVGEASGNRPDVDEEFEFLETNKMYIEIDNSLKEQDKITLIRLDGGQEFYVLERVGKNDEYGF